MTSHFACWEDKVPGLPDICRSILCHTLLYKEAHSHHSKSLPICLPAERYITDHLKLFVKWRIDKARSGEGEENDRNKWGKGLEMGGGGVGSVPCAMFLYIITGRAGGKEQPPLTDERPQRGNRPEH